MKLSLPLCNNSGNKDLGFLRDRYLNVHADSLEKNTLYTARIHFDHMVTTLGEKFLLDDLAQDDLQAHVQRRTSMDIAPVTIKKEINGFRAAWNWGKRVGLISKEWPGKGLVYPKTTAISISLWAGPAPFKVDCSNHPRCHWVKNLAAGFYPAVTDFYGVKDQAENNFRFSSETWSIALRLLSSRSWR